MDFLTHGLLGFILGNSVGLPYGVFGAWMGYLPDLDLLLKPLSKKFKTPALAHRGASHSFLALGVANIIGALVMNFLIPANILIYIGIGFLSMTFHLLFDCLTITPLKPLWPFNARKVRLDIVQSVNFVAAMMSFISGWVLLHFFLAGSPFFFNLTMIILTIMLAIIGIRIAFKVILNRRFKASDIRTIPTTFPFKWRVIQKQQINNEIYMKSSNYNILTSKTTYPREFSISTIRPKLPIQGKNQALAFSYSIPEVINFFGKRLNEIHFYNFIKSDSENPWTLDWFFGERIGYYWTLWTVVLRVEVQSSGEYTAEKKILRLKNW